MPSQTDASKVVYVVSGASRGLGFGVVEQLAKRPTAIIYAGARDPAKADKLQQLAKQHANIHVVQLDAKAEADHKALAALVEAEAGRADVVWANAGICTTSDWAPAHSISIAAIREHIEVNTFHPLLMYQSFYALLHKSSAPKFMVSSTASASTGLLEMLSAIPQLTYGLSKSAVNNLTRRIHFEDKDVIAVPFHPGQRSNLTSHLFRCVLQHTRHVAHLHRCTDSFHCAAAVCPPVWCRLGADRHGQRRRQGTGHGGGTDEVRGQHRQACGAVRLRHARVARRQVLERRWRQGAAVVEEGLRSGGCRDYTRMHGMRASDAWCSIRGVCDA